MQKSIQKKVSENQEKLFSFIQEYLLERGYAPTIREMANGLSKDVKSVHKWLQDLADMQWIEKDKHRSRSIRILRGNLSFYGKEFAVPRVEAVNNLKKPGSNFLSEKNRRKIEIVSLSLLNDYFEQTELKEFKGIIPVPIDEIINWLGYKLQENMLPEGISGLHLIDQKIILINIKDSPDRQRFTKAHEVGHIQLHVKYLQDSKRKIELERLICKSNDLKEMEIEANHFAANILMPPNLFPVIVNEVCAKIHFIRGDAEKERKLIDDISQKFYVSREAIKYRLRDYNYIS